MSTTYYLLAESIKRVEVTKGSTEIALRVTVYVDDVSEEGAFTNIEVLTHEGHLSTVLRWFRGLATAHKYFREGYPVVEYHHYFLPDSTQIISEYNELTTLGELRRHVKEAYEKACEKTRQKDKG